MPIIKTEKQTYKRISKYELDVDVSTHSDGSKTLNNLAEIFKLGCLQRSVEAQESISELLKMINRSLSSLAANSEDIPGRYKLYKQVIKLSARLKTAGLDGDPNSDNRGRPKGGTKAT